MSVRSREIHLASRPDGMPSSENFRLVETELPDPRPGEVLVKNSYMSVEPYMRGRMYDVKSYVPPFELGAVLSGSAVGEVVASSDPSLAAGSQVQSMLGWREFAVAPAAAFTPIDTTRARAADYLGALGVPGFTAWVGLHEIGGLKSDDVVFVSSASGAVGSIAGQLAKLAGARVIGSAGGPEKVRYLTEDLGYDAAFDYKNGSMLTHLRELAPRGIDLYFENVGGDHLEAALHALNPFGRIIACGMISQYNDPQPGPRNLTLIVGKRLTIRGFIVSDHFHRFPDFLRDVGGALADGRIQAPETVFEGIGRAPEAFVALLTGGAGNLGKLLVSLDGRP